MAVTMAEVCDWAGYINDEFVFADFPAGSRVLDIGFGTGEQMRRVRALGCRSVGLDLDPALALKGRQAGLAVCRAKAEHLPFGTASMDGVVCKVVIPYTDEEKAVSEIARVLRPGGTARVSYHGSGYFLRYLIADSNWRRRVYGLRTIVNTFFYGLTGLRLSGFWGDTLYQSERRLRRYYASHGLELVEARPSPGFAGAPVFIYHVLRRT
jgi:ubiquinone/menaquinone biosynthesis C-methylase UbiE